MANYTDNLKFANPVAGECNWNDDWYRNQDLLDVVLRALLSTSRVVSGGEATDQGSLTIQIEPGEATQGETSISWATTQVLVELAPAGQAPLENWIYIDGAGVIQSEIVPPSEINYIPLVMVDTDETGTVRLVDIRPLQTAGYNPGDAIDKILPGTDITDVFLYDTRLDSDGGSWRLNQQLSSWYNEELNTATRGARREFPEVALIIVEALSVTIYDATVPGVDMWMVFNNVGDNTQKMLYRTAGGAFTSVGALNGVMVVGTSGTSGVASIVSFLKDNRVYHWTTTSYQFNGSILERNDELGDSDVGGSGVVSLGTNDVDIIILDTAPIDPATQIAVPTIAVATPGGISVIDGPGGIDTVIGMTCSDAGKEETKSVHFGDQGALYYGFDTPGSRDRYVRVTYTIPSVDTVITTSSSSKQGSDEFYSAGNANIGTRDLAYLSIAANPLNIVAESMIGTSLGFSKLIRNTVDPAAGAIAFIGSDYNSGMQFGDIRLATLADTVDGLIGPDQTSAILNGDFVTDVSEWIDNSDGGVTGMAWDPSQAMRLTELSGEAGVARANQGITLKVDTVYEVSFTLTSVTQSGIGDFRFRAGTTSAGTDTFEVSLGANPTPGTYTATFKTSAASIFFNFYLYNLDVLIDNVSIKETTNEIENYNFSRSDKWTLDANWTIDPVAQLLQCDGTIDAFAYQASVETGKTYRITFEVVNYVQGGMQIRCGYDTVGATNSAAGVYTETLTASGAEGLWIRGFTGFIGDINYIMVEEVLVADRSVESNPLYAAGGITRAAVNGAGSIVGYSGFSDTALIQQSFNDGLDFGTGDFYAMAWFTLENIGKLQMLLGRWQTGALYWDLYSDADGLLKFRINGTSLAGTIPVSGNTYQHVVAMRSGGNLAMYFNGVADPATASEAGSVDYPGGVFQVGSRPDSIGTVFPLDQGAITLVRVGAGAPDADTIKAIYDYEKSLFAGFSAGLASGENVSAISYDASAGMRVGNDNGADYSVDWYIGGARIDSMPLGGPAVAIDHDQDHYAIATSDAVIYHKNKT